jgi:hypothetical protein
LPRLDQGSISGPRWLPFSKWWDEDAIFSSGGGRNLLTRKSLTFGLRNKDGGSHYDPRVEDQDYARMTDGSWIFTTGEKRETVRGEELASMRQIGWEVLQSLKCAELLT